MGQEISFWILAIVAVCAAIGVVAVRNIFRAAMLLVGCFVAIAGVYILLRADFIAVIQILIYVGAVSILIVMGIMLTREITHASSSTKLWLPALPIVGAALAGMIYAIMNTNWRISNTAPLDSGTIAAIADRIFAKNGFLLPLEVMPVLLLATVISAIVLVKVKKK